MIKYRFLVNELNVEMILKRNDMIIETKDSVVADNFVKAWKPCYNSIRKIKVEV